jgi:hypothetical protein
MDEIERRGDEEIMDHVFWSHAKISSTIYFFLWKHKGAKDGRLKRNKRQDYLPQMLWHGKYITKTRMLLW